MQVDWAGETILLQDPVTGEQSASYLFVAVLPCSYYTYAEACDDMKTENWLNCHVHAFDYFGGVARLLIPDNCKTATLSNTRYDVILNRSYQELAEHYGTAIVPARVRKAAGQEFGGGICPLCRNVDCGGPARPQVLFLAGIERGGRRKAG